MTEKYALNIDLKYKKPLQRRKIDKDMDIKDSVMQALDLYFIPEMQRFIDKHGDDSPQKLAELLKKGL